MSIDASLALIPALVDAVERLDRKVDQLLARAAAADVQWVSPAAWARARGCSSDTVARMIASGDLDTRELSRKPLLDKSGAPLLDKEGRPRFRRCLRVKLAPPTSRAEVRALAAAMTGTNGTVGVRRPGTPAEVRR